MLLVFTLINTVRLLLLCLYYLSCHGISSSESLFCFWTINHKISFCLLSLRIIHFFPIAKKRCYPSISKVSLNSFLLSLCQSFL